jgi:ADP-heptose:LPS heptosyltransferase
MSFLKKRSKIPESFLVINTFGIGDVLFSTPLLRNLAQTFPKARFYYMANRKTSGLLSQHPLLKKVFVYERDEFIAESKRSWWKGLNKYIAFISDIRKEKIDVAIDLSLNTPFGLFAMLAGIKERFGLDYKRRGIFLTGRLPIEGFIGKHVAEYYLDVLKLLDIQPQRLPMEVFTDSGSRDWADDFFKKNSLKKGELIIGIAPCGGDAFGKDAKIKRWPPEKYSILIDRLVNDFKAKVFIFAGPKEKGDVAAILSAVKAKNSVFEFSDSSLVQTVALVEHCSLFIGNDTGPMRFADALRKKIVVLFGPVDEVVYGPVFDNEQRCKVIKEDLPCRPCYRKFRLGPCEQQGACLKNIRVEKVLEAIRELLDKVK